MSNFKKFTAVAIAAASLTSVVQGQSTADVGKMDGVKSAQTVAATDMTEGEVRKIDMDAGKLTLKHGHIKNLDMPGMTMVFVVKDKSMIAQLKTGDKIKFKAINEGGKFILTEIAASE